MKFQACQSFSDKTRVLALAKIKRWFKNALLIFPKKIKDRNKAVWSYHTSSTGPDIAVRSSSRTGFARCCLHLLGWTLKITWSKLENLERLETNFQRVWTMNHSKQSHHTMTRRWSWMKNDEMMKENDDFLKMKTKADFQSLAWLPMNVTFSLYEISAFKNFSTQSKIIKVRKQLLATFPNLLI